MKPKKIISAIGIVAVAGGVVGAGIYYVATREPVAIKVDPRVYDDYAGYYDFGNRYVIHVRREGERLMSYAPERAPRELFPETETRFFVKGERVRITFHRNETGRVDHALFQWRNGQEKAERRSELPPAPVFTNGIVAATTGGAATQAGLEILKEGGSSADAAMATALCEVTHAGGSYVSFAGLMMCVAAQGAGYMYAGDWGWKFVEVIQQNGGKITREDMTNYQARWEEPLQTTYREYQVFAPSLSTWGGLNNIEALNLLELADLKSSGPYTTSPRSLLWLMQIAECHKMTWYQHGLSGRDLTPKSRATKETAAWIWSQMQTRKWAWLPDGVRKKLGSHSDGIVVVDRWGNMAVVGHTINTGLWGSTGIFVDGVSIPDPAGVQQNEIARVGPGNRLPNGMNPTLFLRHGKAVLGCSAVGGGLHYKMLQALACILDFGMDPQASVDTPAFLPNGVAEGTFDPKVLDGVKAPGLKVNILSQKGAQWGYWVGVQVDPVSHHLLGGVSRGVEGDVAGY